MKQIRLLSGFFTVGFWTLASRVLGFLREILLAAYVGPGPVLDAFIAAFRLPNMFRRFFAEGAFNAAFVPMFSKKLESGENPQKFATDALNLLALAVLALVGLGMVFMPAMVWVVAGGFKDSSSFDLAVSYGYVVFPYIFFMSLAALFSGVLNATGRFAAAAAAPVLLNIFACGTLIAAALIGAEAINWLVAIIPLAGVAQLALVWIATERAGIHLRPGLPRLTPDMRRMIRIAVPAAMAMGVTQINLVVGQRVASQDEGAISWLFMADRLYQLPLGVIGIAIGIVLLPDLSRRLQAEDETGARNAFSRAGEFALLLTLPSAVAFFVFAQPLISVIFERGRTDATDVEAIALALMVYALGLPAFVLHKILQPLFFARGDTKKPFHYALWSMVINAALAFGLFPVLGWIAPAIAATAAGWVMVLQLMLGARNMGEVARFDTRFRTRLPRILLASAIMGAVLWGLNQSVGQIYTLAYWRYVALLGTILLSMAVYFGAGHLLGALNLREMKASLRRG